ncbi:MAG TPA: LLM class flavin-dependent oxidoreductase [Solirubrobacteraceae bacterium]|nr:LLM class flavin-dependent oxidoreductase [Solirubrobacteraceae bacterium]
MSQSGALEASGLPAARPVQVGLYLTNQHPVGSDMVQALGGQIRLLHHARDHGWDSFWTGQHFLPTMPMTQPVPFLARLAAEAGEMRIGLGILLLALANPLDVAETFASMDVVSGGRFTLGVGLGYRQVEYDGFGILSHDRLRRFEENLKLVQALWAGEAVTSDLPWCRLDAATLTILPIQLPRPPLWMAANNDRAVERAARMADTWIINPHATRSTIARQLELFHRVRRDLGRAPLRELPAIREVVCGRSRERALEMAKPYLTVKYDAYRAWGQDAALPAGETFDLAFERLLEERFVIGTPDDCIQELLQWRNGLGVDHFIFRPFWSGMPVETALESMDLLSREVIPALRKR